MPEWSTDYARIKSNNDVNCKMMIFNNPTNIASVNLVMGCPNARAGVGIVEKKTLRATKF